MIGPTILAAPVLVLGSKFEKDVDAEDLDGELGLADPPATEEYDGLAGALAGRVDATPTLMAGLAWEGWQSLGPDTMWESGVRPVKPCMVVHCNPVPGLAERRPQVHALQDGFAEQWREQAGQDSMPGITSGLLAPL